MQAAAYKRAFQPAKSGHSFVRKLFLFLLIYKAPQPPGASRPTPQRRQHLFLQSKSQPPGLQQPSLSLIPYSFHSFHHPTSQSLPAFIIPLSQLTSHKKTEPSAQFFPLYISSIFPGLYNPQFSSCNTKPKCLRIPAKSGSLLLSSVITGLSFSSHSRLNSISLLPRPL